MTVSERPRTELPLGFAVALRPDLRRLDGGRILIGGSPLRAMRLRTAPRDRITVTEATTERLTRRLLAANMADPIDLPPADAADITVVVPVRDRAEQLDRCLASLTPLRVVVVDDASRDPESTRRIVERHGALLVALTTNRGPADARNAGLEHVETRLVAFVDSDVTVDPATLSRLAGHMADPQVALAGPLVQGRTRSTMPRWFERYDAAASSLALGDRACSVRPRAAVAWLPAACLVARTEVMRRLGGFADGLRIGEDVDLVWRLCAAGHEVRYDPTQIAAHDVRSSLRGWLGRKVAYGTGGAVLAARHGDAVAPAVLSPAIAAAAAALLLRRWWSIPVAAGLVVRSARSVHALLPPAEGSAWVAANMAVAALGWGMRHESALLLRHWWPAAAGVAILNSNARRMIVTALIVDLAVQATSERHQLAEGVAIGWIGRRLDDLAYGAGLWLGAARARSLRCLLPRVAT